jgi:TPR repeat protein
MAATIICGRAGAADLGTALDNYQKKDFAAALPELRELAELGEPRAQFVFGHMVAFGEGVPADLATGHGWMLAAAENGSKDGIGQADTLRANLAAIPAEQRPKADDVLKRYGAGGLAQQLLPTPKDLNPCPNLRGAGQAESVIPEAPVATRRAGQDGDVFLQFTIGVDGLAREIEALAEFPKGKGFADPAMEAVFRSRFRPAELNGRQIESLNRLRVHFRITGGVGLWNDSAVRHVMALAEDGDPGAEFAIGMAAAADAKAFRLTEERARSYVLKAAQAGNPRAQYFIAQFLVSSAPCMEPVKAQRWLDVAVRSAEPAAQVHRARQLLRGNPSADDQVEAKRLLVAAAHSDSVFAMRHAVGILATAPAENVRDLAIAASFRQKVKTKDYEEDPQTWETVAAVSAAGGEFAEAVRSQHKAIRLAETYRWNTGEMADRLAAYSANHAWIGDLLHVPPVPAPGPGPNTMRRCNPNGPTPPCMLEVPPRSVAAAVKPGP